MVIQTGASIRVRSLKLQGGGKARKKSGSERAESVRFRNLGYQFHVERSYEKHTARTKPIARPCR